MSEGARPGRAAWWALGALVLLSALLSTSLLREPPTATEALSSLAEAEARERAGELDAALDAYADAADSARRLRAPLLVARATNRLASLHLRLGDLGRAQPLADEALASAQEASSDAEEAEALFNLGSLQYSLGRMRDALARFEEASEAALRAGDPAAEARAELQVGVAATMMERSDRAAAALARTIALSRERGDAAGEAEGLRVLGQLHSRLGETQEAIERFEEARRLLTPDDAATEATLLNALGQVYFDMGEKETALRHYERALSLNRDLRFPRREAATLLEIGGCQLDLGRPREALEHFQGALAIYRELNNERLEADVLGELGRLHESLGESRTSLEHFERAIVLKSRVGDSRGRAHSLSEAGAVHRKLGDGARALRSFREAAELSRANDDPQGEALALYQMAGVHRDEGRLPEARAAVERSLEIVESLRARVASHDLRTSFFAIVHDRYSFYVDLLLRLHRSRPRQGFDALAFEAAERARARTLVESLQEAAAGVREGIEPALLGEERGLRERLNAAALERMLISPTDAEGAERLRSEIALLASEHDRLQSTIRSRSPRYAALTEPPVSTLAEVQGSLLDEETRLVSFTLGVERSYLFSVTRESYSVHELPARDSIEALAREVNRLLKSPGALRLSREPGSPLERLSSTLLGEVGGLLDKPRLVVVADGALSYVPFAALTAPGAGGEPLVATTEIVRLPSASLLPGLRAQRAGRKFNRFAAVAADPVYEGGDSRVGTPRGGRSPGRRIPRLAASRREALAIRSLAPEGAVLVVTDFEASREWVETTDFREFRVVHLATHGIIDNERPELSGIVLSLARENGEPTDGFLRLEDVYNLKLPVDLVVLSACETGLGKEVRGEGLVGLVRGFMYAGAPAVIASSWKVDDEATTELMGSFYRSLLQGMSPAAALREAQLSMSRSARFRAPYYWAAFELQGDWGVT